MPLTADRVKETTTTTGTGALTLGGAATGYRAFSDAFANPSTVYYCVTDGTNWEVGIGTFTTTLSRDTVLASSNAGALVNWGAGSKDVFSTLPGASVNLKANPHVIAENSKIRDGDTVVVARYVEVAAGVTLEIGTDSDLEVT